MFWTSERVNWREEATGVGARKRSTTTIHAAEGALAPARGHALSTAQLRRSCAWAPARARTSVRTQAHALAGARAPAWACASVHAQAHALVGARAPVRACASVHAQAHALAGARARESRRGARGTPWDQARRQCAAPSPSMPRGWALAQSGRRERGQARRLSQGRFKLVPKRLLFLRLRLGVFLRKLED